ncbi:hypothetical protein TELCIR_13068 [Teladorsagia circumcincta]|uniref:Uncharacterized protein n=1 Tax=Teladorsagia circumcincta TaxID=45464 RepID=A0A2G9U518_TELCI|nr:hypothetical protein TELCIR_13068 [Teladorsagia circumcincta]
MPSSRITRIFRLIMLRNPDDDSSPSADPLPPLFEFNYLLNTSRVEACNAVEKFQITEENYQKAVEFLKRKYGNQEKLFHHIVINTEIFLTTPSKPESRKKLRKAYAQEEV